MSAPTSVASGYRIQEERRLGIQSIHAIHTDSGGRIATASCVGDTWILFVYWRPDRGPVPATCVQVQSEQSAREWLDYLAATFAAVA